MKRIHHALRTSALALLTSLLPCSLIAGPVIVSINDVPNGAPVIQVQGAPNGYVVWPGSPPVADPAIEEGALINLIGVDTAAFPGDPDALPDWEGRFLIPTAPNPLRTAVDIVWVEHDFFNFDEEGNVWGTGDLRVGFDSALAGTYYRTRNSLGLVTDEWVTVYANDTLVIRYKPHTYRLRAQVERPFKIAGLITFDEPTSPFAGTFGVVGNATHLGKFVGNGEYEVTGTSDSGLKVHFHVTATWTAADGSTIKLDMPDWVNQYDASGNAMSSTGLGNIIGGTGRFAGASGSYFGDISPPVINPGVPNDLTGEGTITY